MLPKKSFWLVVLALIILFTLGLTMGNTHETHLSDVGYLHRIHMQACGNGSYALESEELGCSVIYKDGDIITGFTLHIKPKDGDCTCPTEGDVL
jgi:hypothetical protein